MPEIPFVILSVAKSSPQGWFDIQWEFATRFD